jgi:hypothetical protein
MRRLTTTLIVAALSVAFGGVADAHRLKFGKAQRAAQNRADGFAGQQTTLDIIVRQSAHRFYAEAAWTRVNPTGCKECVWDPATGTLQPAPATEYCYADLNIRFKSLRSHSGSRRVRTFITSSDCF